MAQTQNDYRGSRKHVLDLAESGRLAERLNDILVGTDVSLSNSACHRPQGKGKGKEEEWTALRFCEEHFKGLKDKRLENFKLDEFEKWWVPPYRAPQWDLLSTCEINDRPGPLLVEAKANEAECKTEGKPQPKAGSDQSQKNHEKIRKCIKEANRGLKAKLKGFNLTIDSHYQLANRLAFAWKLAACGLDVALLYLGFTGDTGMANVSPPLENEAHWQRVMGAYMKGVAPLALPDKPLSWGEPGSMRFLIRSLPVESISPPKTKK